MATMKTPEEVKAAADRLAKKLADLPHPFGPIGTPMTPEGRLPGYQYLVHNDMAFVLTLVPEQLAESVEWLTRTANFTAYDKSDTVTADINAIRGHLEPWHGTAADAFRQQLDFIKDFTTQESIGLLTLAQPLGGLYLLAKNCRAGYCDFVDHTIAAIDDAIEADEERFAKFMTSLFVGIVKLCADIWNPVSLVGDAAELVGQGIEYSLEGSSIDKVLTSYAKNMTDMHTAFRGELDEANSLLEAANKSFIHNNEFRLFEPLDPNTSVTSPDFNYDDFQTQARSDNDFGPKVDQEKKKEAADPNPQPTGVIQQRLEGAQ